MLAFDNLFIKRICMLCYVMDIDGLDIAGLDNGGLDNDGRMCAQATELKLQNVRMTETDALRVVHCY